MNRLHFLPLLHNRLSFLPFFFSFSCDDEFEQWTSVEPGATVQLPFQSPLSATGRGQGRTEVQKGVKTPRLFIQVEGWSSAYPIALDRLGVFSRIIRPRQDAVSSLLKDFVWFI